MRNPEFFIKKINKGFSLTELLVVVTLGSLLISIALPHFGNLLDRFRLATASRTLVSAISLARSEAIRRGVRVDLVPASSHDWSYGWLVIMDANNNQQRDSGETSLHASGAQPEGLRIVGSLRDAKKTYLAFDPSGRPRSAASSAVPQFGSFLLSVGPHQSKIVIGFLGRVRVCDPVKEGAAC
jgi:type IV fimbrial biogenesis protein FimT